MAGGTRRAGAIRLLLRVCSRAAAGVSWVSASWRHCGAAGEDVRPGRRAHPPGEAGEGRGVDQLAAVQVRACPCCQSSRGRLALSEEKEATLP